MELFDVAAVRANLEEGYMVMDARPSEFFLEGFLAGAVSIPFGEEFIERFQELVSDEQKIVLVAEEKDIPAIARLLKLSGSDNTIGYFSGNYNSWQEAGLPTDLLIGIEADEFAMDYQFDEFFLIDIRSAEEYTVEHAEDAENIELYDLEQILTDLDVSQLYYFYGNSANDAVMAGSIFKSNGFHRVRAVTADLETIKSTGIPWFTAKKKDNTAK